MPAALRVLCGLVAVVAGLTLMCRTVLLLARRGRGTLAPWDPTTRLVVAGPYRYVHNPMIAGVALVLAGEAAIFGSVPLLVWAGVFIAVNAVWFPLVEEPGLVRRFGDDYPDYVRNVPRWIPRRRPWRPGNPAR